MIVANLLNYLGVVLVTFLVAIGGNRLFNFLGFLDRPGRDIIPPRKPVANYQGIFLILSAWISVIIFFPGVTSNSQIFWLLIGGTILGLFALINDVVDRYTEMRGIPAYLRLIVQLLLISIIIYQTKVYVGLDPFGFEINHTIGFVMCVLWVVGFMNAINWFDFNGIAGGVSTLGFGTIALLISFVVIPYYNPIGESLYNLIQINQTAMLLACITIVFVIQELKPWGLLRDVGSNFLGFLLAYLALMGGAKVGLMVATLSLVICDAIRVVFWRILVIKKNPLTGDYTHLHHRLQTIGRTRSEIRGFVWSWTVTMMILMLLQGNNSFNKLIIAIVFGGIFFGVHYYLYVIKKIPYEFKATTQ